ncbi:uncharacterized protein LOC122789044 [Protopterus annectens]|uniref:uncharacterized protein LOC122789044 n=1 Tax=Protopterus annectens TaxID=7888 RepID=UPI001CF95854|nr:uncharacterized protein LOC122789044 [Protopterus annectens]
MSAVIPVSADNGRLEMPRKDMVNVCTKTTEEFNGNNVYQAMASTHSCTEELAQSDLCQKTVGNYSGLTVSHNKDEEKQRKNIKESIPELFTQKSLFSVESSFVIQTNFGTYTTVNRVDLGTSEVQPIPFPNLDSGSRKYAQLRKQIQWTQVIEKKLPTTCWSTEVAVPETGFIQKERRRWNNKYSNPMKSASAGDNNLFTEQYCNICNAQLISESQRVAHYESKKHANKVKLYYMLHPEDGGPPSKKLCSENPESDENQVDSNKCCALCNMFFTSAIVAQSHYQGKTHAKRMKLVLGEQPSTPTTTESAPSTPQSASHYQSSSWPTFNGLDMGKTCHLCNALFNNPGMAQQHYEGKKHKRNAVRLKLLEQIGDSPRPRITQSFAKQLQMQQVQCRLKLCRAIPGTSTGN